MRVDPSKRAAVRYNFSLIIFSLNLLACHQLCGCLSHRKVLSTGPLVSTRNCHVREITGYIKTHWDLVVVSIKVVYARGRIGDPIGTSPSPFFLHLVMDATQHRGWGGLGHVNVPCNLHVLWMVRNTGVGVGWSMLTFHVTYMRCGCYATRGLGWGGAC